MVGHAKKVKVPHEDRAVCIPSCEHDTCAFLTCTCVDIVYIKECKIEELHIIYVPT